MFRFAYCIGFLGLIGFAGCESSAEDWPKGRPQIVDVNYFDQSSWDASSLNFELEFADTDGDLGTGSLAVSVNSEATSNIGLAEVFAAQLPVIAPDAVSGSIQVSLTLSGVTLVSGETVDFEFALTDASGQTSNEASLSLLTIVRGDE